MYFCIHKFSVQEVNEPCVQNTRGRIASILNTSRFVCMPLYFCASHMYVGSVPRDQKSTSDIPGGRVTGVCEPSDMDPLKEL